MSIKSNIVILYIIAALITAVLGYAFYYNLQFDANSSAGVIVAALCGIVTLLIGFQIYNAIEIKREIRKNKLSIKRFESLYSDRINRIETVQIENRYLSDSIITLKKAMDWKRWNDIPYLYLEIGQLIKYLVLSNLKRYDIDEERNFLEDSFFSLTMIIDGLKKEKNHGIIQVFNNNTTLYDRLNSELMSLFEDESYKLSEGYLDKLTDLKNQRHELLLRYGKYQRDKPTE